MTFDIIMPLHFTGNIINGLTNVRAYVRSGYMGKKSLVNKTGFHITRLLTEYKVRIFMP